jgi:hypothetical protein
VEGMAEKRKCLRSFGPKTENTTSKDLSIDGRAVLKWSFKK